MEPELHLRVKNLFDVIQIVIDSGIFFEQLFKLLTLDLSQCMKKSILLVIINYLLNKKIDDFARFRNLELLFLNNCIEISLFVLTVFKRSLRGVFLFKSVIETARLILKGMFIEVPAKAGSLPSITGGCNFITLTPFSLKKLGHWEFQ